MLSGKLKLMTTPIPIKTAAHFRAAVLLRLEERKEISVSFFRWVKSLQDIRSYGHSGVAKRGRHGTLTPRS